MRSRMIGGVVLAVVSTIGAVGVPAHAADAETLTATFPTGTHQVGAQVQITGEITGQHLDAPTREVDVQVRGTNGTWMTLTTAATEADGTFSVAAPTWWVATQTMRILAPATATEAELTSTTTG